MTTNRNGRVIPAAVLLGVASLGSRLVGLVRERVLTTTFGAGDTFDAFVAAFRIPDAIFNLIVIGALSAAFIPLFTEKLLRSKDKEKEAFQFAAEVLNTILLAVIGLSVIYVAFANIIVPLITPGFSGDKLRLTITLSRIMALQPILLSISFVFSGVLNSYKRFFASALAPIVYNIGIIIGVKMLYPVMGVAGLGWGVVLGGALHMIVQLPSVIRAGFTWRPAILASRSDRRKLWRMMLPRVFGLAADQINLFTVTIIGSGLLAGSIAIFHVANNLQSLPVGIFGLAFAQAVFPTLAEQVARGQKGAFRETLVRAFSYILFFIIPLSVFFFLLRAQIIRVLFRGGAFDPEDGILTFQTFGWLIISIFSEATIPLLTRAFYVQQNTRTPVIISVISVVANIILAVWLSPLYGVQGLALAFSIASIINLVLLLGILHWQLKGLNDRQVLLSLLRITTASVIAGIAVQLLKYPVAQLVNVQHYLGVLLQLLITGAVGGIVYVALCWLFKSEELNALYKYLPKRLKGRVGLEASDFGMTK